MYELVIVGKNAHGKNSQKKRQNALNKKTVMKNKNSMTRSARSDVEQQDCISNHKPAPQQTNNQMEAVNFAKHKL